MLDRFPADEYRSIVELRRDLHRHPELAFEESRTGALVAAQLARLGAAVATGVGKTGVTADVGEGGARLLVRADMDALPLTEASGEEFSSEEAGRMHACGHDGHVAIALAAAGRLRRDPPARGLRFLFQPAEERGGGARACVADGVLDGVTAAIGLPDTASRASRGKSAPPGAMKRTAANCPN